MSADRTSKGIALAALAVALVALALSVRAFVAQRAQDRRIEALGDLIERSTRLGQPILNLGGVGSSPPQLDTGE